VWRKTRAAVDHLLFMLDTEGVELFQWLFYIIIAVDGLQNLLLAHDMPLTLQNTMDYRSFTYWCGLEIAAPTICLIGRAMHRTSYKRQANTFQMFGDMILGSSEVAYVIGTFHAEPIGKGGHGGYLGLAFCISAFLLALRSYRRRKAEG
jgi:hypothetical protein